MKHFGFRKKCMKTLLKKLNVRIMLIPDHKNKKCIVPKFCIKFCILVCFNDKTDIYVI